MSGRPFAAPAGLRRHLRPLRGVEVQVPAARAVVNPLHPQVRITLARHHRREVSPQAPRRRQRVPGDAEPRPRSRREQSSAETRGFLDARVCSAGLRWER